MNNSTQNITSLADLLAAVPANKAVEFSVQYSNQNKKTGLGYVFLFIYGLHYAYTGQWGLQIIFWLTLGGLGIWWLIDLFRVPGIVEDYNRNLAVSLGRRYL